VQRTVEPGGLDFENRDISGRWLFTRLDRRHVGCGTDLPFRTCAANGRIATSTGYSASSIRASGNAGWRGAEWTNRTASAPKQPLASYGRKAALVSTVMYQEWSSRLCRDSGKRCSVVMARTDGTRPARQ
jgi:hypothetical protein